MNLDSAEQENEVESSKILRDRWQKAFPFASFAPVLQEPTEEDRRLARMFCPQLHVWSNLFVQERKFLSKSIGSIACAESFFLHTLGSFPEDTSGAEFYLLSSAKERIENNKHRESLYTNIPETGKIYENSELHRLLEEKCDKTLMNKARDKAIELFEEHFPQEGPTCAIKYRVVHSPTNPSLYCIQYFTYWPVQISPFHMFDYEPVYVFVKKETDPKKNQHFVSHPI